MVPVIITTNARGPERIGMALQVLATWRRNADVRVIVLDNGADPWLWKACREFDCMPDEIVCFEAEHPMRERHVLAQKLAGDALWSIWTDDDIVVPIGAAWMDFAFAVLRIPGPNWGLVAVQLPNCELHPGARANPPIGEAASVGGCRFVRRGVPSVFPAMTELFDPGYDIPLCKQVLVDGYGVGVFTHPRLRAVHLGETQSALWPHIKVQQ